MRIVWTVHALERLAQRNIPKDAVISTIRAPDIKMKVITAYETSRLDKYLG
jgi:hypothetical protein